MSIIQHRFKEIMLDAGKRVWLGREMYSFYRTCPIPEKNPREQFLFHLKLIAWGSASWTERTVLRLGPPTAGLDPPATLINLRSGLDSSFFYVQAVLNFDMRSTPRSIAWRLSIYTGRPQVVWDGIRGNVNQPSPVHIFYYIHLTNNIHGTRLVI